MTTGLLYVTSSICFYCVWESVHCYMGIMLLCLYGYITQLQLLLMFGYYVCSQYTNGKKTEKRSSVDVHSNWCTVLVGASVGLYRY